MKLRVVTPVEQDYRTVWQRFDRQLFEALNPPFPPVKVLRFDGSLTGHFVELELDFLLFKNDWLSEIVEQDEEQEPGREEIYFVDVGRKLPFFLSAWRHKHRIVKSGEGAKIIDEIEFKTPYRWLDWFFYPQLYLQFAYRAPVYKRYFRRQR